MLNNSWTQAKATNNKEGSILVEQQTQAELCGDMLSNLIKTGRVSIGDTLTLDGDLSYIDNMLITKVTITKIGHSD